MNAQALERRLALESLITLELEPVQSDSVGSELDQDVLDANCEHIFNEEWDLMQDDAENEFYQEVQESSQHRFGRSARNAW
jgi:hypothetical protein